jgi:DNA-binding SARP family transcriptional activator/predicted ATPase
MRQLSARLLGPFTAAGEAGELRLPTDKTRALLAYLALNADTPLRREQLAGLLWPDQPDAQARQNLRKTLGRLKQAVQAADPALADELLNVTQQTVALASAAASVDALDFRARLEAVARHAHAGLAQCVTCLADLAAAVTLAQRGELLAGLSLPDAAPFEDWLVVEREHFHQQHLQALQSLAEAYEAQGQPEKASQAAREQLQLEPWREEAHRQLMRLLAGHGRRAEAIAQYQACRRVLEAELGVTPAAETEALLAQIMDGAPAVVGGAVAARPQPWPRHSGHLVGRATELDELLGLLAQPDCRVLTVTGLGGIGKTSLALALGERLSQAPPPWLADGVYLAPVATLTDAAGLPAAVADAIGLPLNPRLESAAQVEQALRPKSALVILDNLEQLVDDAGWLRALSADCPHLKLLITSREPLNWQDEWRYPLEGLAYPPDARAAGQGQYEAVQLFVQAARQVKPDFADTAANGPAIARICQLVRGWPLALRMAAAWVAMMDCAAIAEQISANLDFLATALQDVPPRQRSLRAIFDHTWEALSPAEQRVLAQLSIFRGDFALNAAVTVAATSPLGLRSLVEKALVQPDERSGRFYLHALLRQFAQARGAADPAALAEAEAAHGRYYLAWLHTEGARLNTIAFQAALAVVRADLDNLHQAWLWAATQRQTTLLADNLSQLVKVYESSGQIQEAISLFRRTIVLLDEAGPARPTALIAQIWLHLANSLRTLGQYAEATAAISTGQALAAPLGEAALTNGLYIAQAHVYREQGRYAEAQAVLAEAIADSQAHAHPLGVARALHIQGNTYWSMAEYAQARSAYEASRQLYEQLGDSTAVALLTGNIGVVLWRQGNLPAALENYQIALAALRQVGNASSVAIWLGNIGLIYVDMHADEEALAYLDEALTMHDQLGGKYYRMEVLLGKVNLFMRRGALDAAAELLQQAVELSYRLGNRTYLRDCDLWQARLFRRQGRPAEALTLLKSLQTREFRPDVLSVIAQEVHALTAAPPTDG